MGCKNGGRNIHEQSLKCFLIFDVVMFQVQCLFVEASEDLIALLFFFVFLYMTSIPTKLVTAYSKVIHKTSSRGVYSTESLHIRQYSFI